MPGDAGIKVDGARRLRSTLKAAGDDLSDLKAAHAAAAQIVAGSGGAGAPRVTGALAGTVRSSGTTTAAIVRAGKAAVPYAAPIHWGWFSRHIRPNPWLSRAAQQTEPTWQPIYMAAVNRAVDKVKGL
jgi:hypothetical protein